MKRAFVLGLFLALAGTARADAPQPFDPQHAVKLAHEHFRQTPACGWPIVLYRVQADAPLAARPDWMGMSPLGTCTIVIRAREEWEPTWEEFCRITVHEYGHLLLGPEHDPNPRSVMYWSPAPGSARECQPRAAVRRARAHYRR